jgi:hypothetical protein
VDLAAVADRFLETLPVGPARRKYERDFVPIDVPDDEADLLDDTAPQAMTAEDWLARLDGVPMTHEPSSAGHARHARFGSRSDLRDSRRFQWRERVGMLDQKLRGFCAATDDAFTKREVDHLRKTAVGVWRAHDPNEPGRGSGDRGWRRWVRAGLWQVLDRLDKRRGLLRPLSGLAGRWKRAVPKVLREFDIGR